MFERSWRISLSQSPTGNSQLSSQILWLISQRLFVIAQRDGILVALKRKLRLLAQIMAAELLHRLTMPRRRQPFRICAGDKLGRYIFSRLPISLGFTRPADVSALSLQTRWTALPNPQ